MNKDEFDHYILSIIEGAEGDPRIMTGLPAVDLKNEVLRFTRAIEICEKIETIRKLDKNSTEYQWYENLELDDPKRLLSEFWSNHRVQSVRKK